MTSAGARSLAQNDLVKLDDDAAYELFEAIRWCDTDGQPKCPKCESLKVHRHRTRRIFSCASCNSQFSATSGTYFHARKLSMQKILEGILTFANGAKGVAALEMSRSLDVSHKTAFVWEHKLREGVHGAVSDRKMSGEVEVDGVYLGGYLKPANWRENRRDRRLARNQNGKRRVVVVIRERHGRTRTVVVRYEHHAIDQLKKIIKPGTTVYCDEAHSWDELKYAGYDVRQVNHQECYSDDGRACTNWAESYNSRLRRAESGVYHHVAGPYLDLYADEMAWREDARRIDNGRQFLLLCLHASTSGRSRFSGYWQCHRKK